VLACDAERARLAMAEHVAGTAALLRAFLGSAALRSAEPASAELDELLTQGS
jgi:hypothetical protein